MLEFKYIKVNMHFCIRVIIFKQNGTVQLEGTYNDQVQLKCILRLIHANEFIIDNTPLK